MGSCITVRAPLSTAGWLLSVQLQMQTLEPQWAACTAGPGTCIQISPREERQRWVGRHPLHRAETPAVVAAAGMLARGPN